MNIKFFKTNKKLSVAVLLILGLGLTVLIIKTGPQPVKRTANEHEYLVNAIVASPVDVVPRIQGYGEVEPDRVWRSVSQVSGKIIWKSEKLKSGEFFKAGQLMLRIDDKGPKLAIQKGLAEIKKYQSKIEELESNKKNMELRYAILKKVYAFNNKKLTRQKKLFISKAVAAATVDEEEINVLQQQSTIAALATNIKLIPAQIAYQQAELASAKANLKQFKLDLSYTEISAPFDCRVRTVSIGNDQYLTSGQEMFIADAIDKVEIPVQVSMNQLSMLINPAGKTKVEENKKRAKENKRVNEWNITVQVNGGTKKYSWEGRFLRIASGVDTSTRMLNMIIGVPEPYHRNINNLKPPLEIGQFCSVKIRGKVVKNLLVIPRYALHDSSVYIADKNSRLEIRTVKTGFNIEQYTIIESGLKPGEKIIVSDIVPAVQGMRLRLKIDNSFIKKARQELSGKEADHD